MRKFVASRHPVSSGNPFRGIDHSLANLLRNLDAGDHAVGELRGRAAEWGPPAAIQMGTYRFGGL